MADEPREVLPASAQANKFPGLVESDVPTIEPGAITFAVIPDSQSAVGPYPDIYEAQMEGIDELCGPLNIAGVFHVGDITNDNTKREWEYARAGMNQLLSKVPCLVVPGNHDMPGHGKIRDTERFNSHFPLAKLCQQARAFSTYSGS